MGAISGARPEPLEPGAPESLGWRPGDAIRQRESDMLRFAEVGELMDLGEGPFDLPTMKTWDPERTIRAAVLRHLLVNGQWPVHAKGVRLRHQRVSGRLDLEAATLRCPLVLQDCYLDDPGPVILDYATASLLSFTGCCLGGLAGDTLTVTKDLDLAGSTFTGSLSLPSADICGTLSCDGAKLTAADNDGYALVGHGMKVGGGAFLGGGLTAAGAIDLTAADITHNLTCRGVARLTRANSDGNALIADATRVGGHMLLDGGFTAAGAIYLVDADITGSLNCSGAQVTAANRDGTALAADRMKAANVSLDGWVTPEGAVQSFTAAGTVNLAGADITGNLSCSGAQLTAGADGTALAAYQMKAANVSLDGWVTPEGAVQSFTAAGTVNLTDADITGSLSCSGAQLTAGADGTALAADRVKIGGDVTLTSVSTQAGAIRLPGAHVSGLLNCRGAQLTAGADGNALAAYGIKAGDDVLLDEGFTAAGTVNLAGADITGNLSCSGAQLTAGADGTALAAYRMKAANVSLDGWVTPEGAVQSFTAAGTVNLAGADITGNLSCSGAQLTAGADGTALAAYQMKAANVSLDGWVTPEGAVQSFTAAGTVNLTDADITGSLSCSGAQLTAGADGTALAADRVKIGGDVTLTSVSTQAGAIRLPGAHVSGLLNCRGAQLTAGADGNALAAYGIKAGDDVLLDEGFTAAGTVNLAGADITGNLSCSGAQLTAGADGTALAAYRVKIGGDVTLDRWLNADGTIQRLTAKGTILLADADIRGSLSCCGAQLTAGSGGNALAADRIKVGGDVSLAGCDNADGTTVPFTTNGSVQLRWALVDGSLLLESGEFDASLGEMALDATGAHVSGKLKWVPNRKVVGTVSLEDAEVGLLEDDWTSYGPGRGDNGYWPRAADGQLLLGGFVYTRMAQHTASPEQRLEWIGSQRKPPRWRKMLVPRTAWSESKARREWRIARKPHGFAPQPYEQLASVYQQAGLDAEARTVAIARRRDLRLYGATTRRRKAGNWLLDKSIQYGYQTWRAIVGIAVLYIIVLGVFWYAQHQANLIVPVQSTMGLPTIPTAASCTSYYPCFYPVGYAIDTVIPLVNVHQADYWGPNASAPFGWVYVLVTWVGIVLGWAFATLAVAGYTGLVRNPDSL